MRSTTAWTSLADATGRRVVLVFTDGDDDKSRRSTSTSSWRARRNEEIMIYAIGLRKNYMGTARGPDPTTCGSCRQQTGGGYFELTQTTELSSTFTRIADELHRQYVLGFTPASFDGKIAPARRARESRRHDRARAQELHRREGAMTRLPAVLLVAGLAASAAWRPLARRIRHKPSASSAPAPRTVPVYVTVNDRLRRLRA